MDRNLSNLWTKVDHRERCGHRILNEMWLENHYPDMLTYASDVVKFYMGNAVYGMPCELSPEGKVTLDPESEATVHKLSKQMVDAGYKWAVPEYQMAVYGDFETSLHKEYKL